jgi:hypothetical protein
MKITQRQLRQIIREELERNMNEGFFQNAMTAALGGRARRDREAERARRAELDVAPETPYKPYEYETPSAVGRAAEREERERATSRAYAQQTIWNKDVLEMSEDEYEARRREWLDSAWAGKYKDYTVTNWSMGVEDAPLATYLSSGEWRSDPDLAGVRGGDDMMLRSLLPMLDVNGSAKLSPGEVNDIVNLWDMREISPYAKSYDAAVYSAENSY